MGNSNAHNSGMTRTNEQGRRNEIIDGCARVRAPHFSTKPLSIKATVIHTHTHTHTHTHDDDDDDDKQDADDDDDDEMAKMSHALRGQMPLVRTTTTDDDEDLDADDGRQNCTRKQCLGRHKSYTIYGTWQFGPRDPFRHLISISRSTARLERTETPKGIRADLAHSPRIPLY